MDAHADVDHQRQRVRTDTPGHAFRPPQHVEEGQQHRGTQRGARGVGHRGPGQLHRDDGAPAGRWQGAGMASQVQHMRAVGEAPGQWIEATPRRPAEPAASVDLVFVDEPGMAAALHQRIDAGLGRALVDFLSQPPGPRAHWCPHVPEVFDAGAPVVGQEAVVGKRDAVVDDAEHRLGRLVVRHRFVDRQAQIGHVPHRADRRRPELEAQDALGRLLSPNQSLQELPPHEQRDVRERALDPLPAGVEATRHAHLARPGRRLIAQALLPDHPDREVKGQPAAQGAVAQLGQHGQPFHRSVVA
jgi:hypothetical protein